MELTVTQLNQLVTAMPNYTSDKIIAKFSDTVPVSGAAFSEGIYYIPHGLGEAQLPKLYYKDTLANYTVEANYQYGNVIMNCACDATNIILPWVNVAGGNHSIEVIVWLIDKWQR